MRFYVMMAGPASRKKSALKLLAIVGGFALFSVIAMVDQRLALAAAVGTIGFAAISMLIAITRKH